MENAREVTDPTIACVLLYNLTEQEHRIVREVLVGLNGEVKTAENVPAEELEGLAQQEHLSLVIFRADDALQGAAQAIRHLKKHLPARVPLLLLVPQELAPRIKRYMKAGVDDYWLLPLDRAAFPSRLQVLLEWGQAILRGDSCRLPSETVSNRTPGSRWSRLWQGLRDWLPGRHSSTASTNSGASQTAIGRWEKVRRLGFGSFGEVWLMQHQTEGNLVVAKFPHDPKMNARFLREAAILKRLADHPNAVELVEVVRAKGGAILIQEYVKGVTLQECIDQGMDSITKEKVFRQLVAIVAYAHEQRIMHRDIKPENIMITPEGDLKLLDFGTGKDLTHRSISSTVVGSRPFMAPEQILGKSRMASDVWALGVILYALATECLPFYAENEKELMDLILETEPERPCELEADIPGALEQIILKCLVKDWQQRFQQAGELQEALLQAFPHFGDGLCLP